MEMSTIKSFKDHGALLSSEDIDFYRRNKSRTKLCNIRSDESLKNLENQHHISNQDQSVYEPNGDYTDLWM